MFQKVKKKILVNKAIRIHFLSLSELEEFSKNFQDFLYI